MSQENVEIVRRLYEHWARGDFSAPGFFDPDVVYSRIGTETPGMEGEWRGLEAMSAEPAAAEPAPLLAATSAADDAQRLSMSTLSFQDYVRTRMLKRRQASLAAAPAAPAANAAANAESAPASATAAASSAAPAQTAASSVAASARLDVRLADEIVAADVAAAQGEPVAKSAPVAAPTVHIDAPAALQREQALLAELRAVKDLIEERFGALAFMEKLQRRPAEARLAQKLLDCGFSPLLVRKMAEGFRVDAGDEGEWAAQVLEKKLRTA